LQQYGKSQWGDWRQFSIELSEQFGGIRMQGGVLMQNPINEEVDHA